MVAMLFTAAMLLFATTVVVIVIVIALLVVRLAGCLCLAAFDDLIDLTPVKPYAPALWTVIYLDTLAIAHY
jgi:hypothetical protein